MKGNSENQPSAEFEITIEIGNDKITYKRPLIFKWNDPVKGEQTKSWIVCPKVTANINKNIMIFSEKKQQSMSTVTLTAHTKDQEGTIKKIIKPEGWSVSGPKEYRLQEKDQQMLLEYQITPQKNSKNGLLKIELNDQEAFAFNTIKYDHIKQQTWFPKSNLQLSYLNLNVVPKK